MSIMSYEEFQDKLNLNWVIIDKNNSFKEFSNERKQSYVGQFILHHMILYDINFKYERVLFDLEHDYYMSEKGQKEYVQELKKIKNNREKKHKNGTTIK